MIYYLLLKGDKESESIFDSNVLGEESFGTFYSENGLIALKNIVNVKPELLESITVIDERGSTYTVEEFLELLSKFKIRQEYR